MDKLKQVQKFQFWILLGVALILPLVGWTMARSGLIADAEKRTTELTSLKDSLKSDTNDPNKDWETGLEEINKLQSVQPGNAAKVLYERQLPLMTWPSQMPNDSALFQTKHQEFYRTVYRRGSARQRPLIEEVRKIVKPYDEDAQTGLVIYPEELLPNPDSEWVSQAPSIKQIEAAQEDLWLLSAILKQIAAVNEDEDAHTPFEAAIRQITDLYLRGGSTTKGTGGTSSGATKASSTGGMGGAMAKSFESMSTSKNMGGGGSGMGGGRNSGGEGATSITNPKINPEDVLGAEQAAATDKPATETKSTGKSLMSGMNTGGPSSGGMGGSGSSGRWSGSNMGRYREDKPEYRTRGFYLEVIMDHRRIPELLASLANADWPINVLHVQEADFRDEDLAEAGGGSAGLAGMGSSRSMGSGMGGGPMGGRMGGGGPPGMGGGGPGGRSGSPQLKGPVRSADESGEESLSNRSALDDPNLANVAIVGVIYIFKKPDEKAGAANPASPAPGSPAPGSSSPGAAPATSPVASVPAAGDPAATNGDSSKTPPVAADSETAADDAVKDDSKTLQPDPATAAPENGAESKPEKKPAEGDAPANKDSPEKAAPDKSAGKS